MERTVRLLLKLDGDNKFTPGAPGLPSGCSTGDGVTMRSVAAKHGESRNPRLRMMLRGVMWGMLMLAGLLSWDRFPMCVWIVADDMSPDTGAYGNRRVHTPHLDRLRRTGNVTRERTRRRRVQPSRSHLFSVVTRQPLAFTPTIPKKPQPLCPLCSCANAVAKHGLVCDEFAAPERSDQDGQSCGRRRITTLLTIAAMYDGERLEET